MKTDVLKKLSNKLGLSKQSTEAYKFLMNKVNEAYIISDFARSNGGLKYIADMENYTLIWANDSMKKTFGDDIIGKKCHKVLQGLDKPCVFCNNSIIKDLPDYDVYVWKHHNERLNKTFIVVNWKKTLDGRSFRYENAIDISGVK